MSEQLARETEQVTLSDPRLSHHTFDQFEEGES